MNIASIRPIRQLVQDMRDELSARREAHRTYQNLQRELSSYRTPREVSELLALISDQEGPEADQVREVLLNNLRPQVEPYRAA